ncbi:hypothetical protein [Rarobacter incanus]|uniref:Uncharacterized protein n=1 Tax=Rarobacter incanus TaxID=153494 RepID=A0A542SQP0_9MICO|nr:hypothetical protein [Rarobacter incanus]TQK76929.1 hypothetical protein FB389_1631 [Rarobacter incanus]
MRNEPVYRRRRAVALTALIVVVALLVWAIGAIIGALRPGTKPRTSASPSAAATSAAATGAPQNCSADGLVVALATKGDSFALGGKVPFAVSITSTADADCLIDVSDTSRVLTIRSGSDQVWSSADCGSADPKELLMSKGSKEAHTVTWKIERSVAGCKDGQPALRAGTYRAQVSVSGAKSDEVSFILK